MRQIMMSVNDPCAQIRALQQQILAYPADARLPILQEINARAGSVHHPDGGPEIHLRLLGEVLARLQGLYPWALPLEPPPISPHVEAALQQLGKYDLSQMERSGHRDVAGSHTGAGVRDMKERF